MTPRPLPWTAALLLALAACGASTETPPVAGDLDTSKDGIARYLREGRYRGWTADAAPRDSLRNSPHGKVRVFFDPKLEASLRAGNAVHPAGSIVVKEAYASDGETPITRLLDVKVADGTGLDTWVYFEGAPSDDFKAAYYGRGLQVCTGCHADGRDSVLSPLP